MSYVSMTGVCIDNVLIHAIIHLLFKSTLALKTLLMKMPWVLIFWTILQWYAILLDYTGEYEGTKQRITNSYLVKEHFKVCYGFKKYHVWFRLWFPHYALLISWWIENMVDINVKGVVRNISSAITRSYPP